MKIDPEAVPAGDGDAQGLRCRRRLFSYCGEYVGIHGMVSEICLRQV
jgi:hypothetical protein